MPRGRLYPGRSSWAATPRTKGSSTTAGALLRAIDEAGHPFTEIGVPSYPEGHVDIPDARLVEVLLEKQRYASYMTTQMCFNPGAIVHLDRNDARGLHRPARAPGDAGRGRTH